MIYLEDQTDPGQKIWDTENSIGNVGLLVMLFIDLVFCFLIDAIKEG